MIKLSLSGDHQRHRRAHRPQGDARPLAGVHRRSARCDTSGRPGEGTYAPLTAGEACRANLRPRWSRFRRIARTSEPLRPKLALSRIRGEIMGMETRGLLAWSLGGTLVLSYAVSPHWWNFDRVVAVLSAIGTIAAAWVALWIALRNGAERRAEQRSEAALEAAVMEVRLGPLLADLQVAMSRYRIARDRNSFEAQFGPRPWTVADAYAALHDAIYPLEKISFDHAALVRLATYQGALRTTSHAQALCCTTLREM